MPRLHRPWPSVRRSRRWNPHRHRSLATSQQIDWWNIILGTLAIKRCREAQCSLGSRVSRRMPLCVNLTSRVWIHTCADLTEGYPVLNLPVRCSERPSQVRRTLYSSSDTRVAQIKWWSLERQSRDSLSLVKSFLMLLTKEVRQCRLLGQADLASQSELLVPPILTRWEPITCFQLQIINIIPNMPLKWVIGKRNLRKVDTWRLSSRELRARFALASIPPK